MVATPIGNMGDISQRAISTLKGAEVVFAEDTRVARSLLKKLDIETSVQRYDHHSHGKNIKNVLRALEEGRDIAYVSDAGTPGVEDPGGRLVEAVVQEGYDVSPIPGASAVIAALSISGFPADKFTVVGFPPKKKGRQTYFDRLSRIKGTVVIYESTHRILKTVAEIADRQPEREMVIARELTKKFETVLRGIARELSEKLSSQNTKGEFMIVIK